MRYRNHDPILLGLAFKKLLEKAPKDLGLVITIDSVSIVDRMMEIIDALRANQGPLVFHKLIPDLTSRSSIIGSFVAMLELCKRRVIRVQQDEIFQDIYVVLSGSEFDFADMRAELDAEPMQAKATANG